MAQLKAMDKRSAKRIGYLCVLESDQPARAAVIRTTIEADLADVETFGQTDHQSILTGHDTQRRKLSFG